MPCPGGLGNSEGPQAAGFAIHRQQKSAITHILLYENYYLTQFLKRYPPTLRVNSLAKRCLPDQSIVQVTQSYSCPQTPSLRALDRLSPESSNLIRQSMPNLK